MLRTHVDLFSGIGGFALACRWAGVETIAFAEIDGYASRVLQRHWPNVRNYGDVRDVPAMRSVWLVSGGVPCQPASVAGKRRGAADDRWLWPQALAVVERIRPAWVLFENPSGILSLNDGLEFERICAALEGQGYEVQSLIIPACAAGTFQHRERLWICAYAECKGLSRYKSDNGIPSGSDTSYAQPSNRMPESWDALARHCGGLRGDNGLSVSMVRREVRGYGNAIVPQVAYQLIKRMIEVEETLSNGR